MLLEEHIQRTETRQFRIVFPAYLNDNGILFGGTAMKWMDEVAYITAQRFTRQKMITVTVEKVNFRKAIEAGAIIEIIGKVIHAGRVKINIQVEIYKEDLQENTREKAVDALFTFAVINEKFKPLAFNLESCLNT